MIKRKLSETKGSFYIDLLVGILVLFVILSVILSVMPAFVVHQKLTAAVNSYCKIIANAGELSATTDAALNEIMNTHNVTLDNVTYDTTFIPGGKKMQIGTPFTVELTTRVTIGGGRFDFITVTLKAKGGGVTEKFWK